nr:retrovirus-related Pol polyprotein from transposon TNT 1-94 [Tanacetum cinerariifolium]
MMSEKKVNTKPVDYVALNQLSHDLKTRFVPQTELSVEQAFWSQNSRNFEEPNLSTSTTIVEVPKELPKVSMVNSSLKKLKFHLASFDVVGISHETSVARSPQQNGVVERRNRMLIEAARTMLIYTQAPLFIWAEVVATACYTQNRSIIRLRHRKTPYELLHNKLHDLSFLYVFGALCYPTNYSENLGKLQPKADIGIFNGYAPTKKAFRIYNMTISSGLVPKPSSSTPYVLPSRNDRDLLFQLLFDELLTPSPSVDPPAPEVITLIADVIPPVKAELTGLPTSTTVDQDAPSPSKSQTTPE